MRQQDSISEIRNTIDVLVRNMVDDPTSVDVYSHDGENEKGPLVCFKIKCSGGDKGKVIGKAGSNINAIRQVVRAMSANKRIFSDVNVEE